MTTIETDQLIQALTERAVAGDNEAARLVLAQPRRFKIVSADDDEIFDARSAYRGLWHSLATGQMSVPEARDLIELLNRLERCI